MGNENSTANKTLFSDQTDGTAPKSSLLKGGTPNTVGPAEVNSNANLSMKVERGSKAEQSNMNRSKSKKKNNNLTSSGLIESPKNDEQPMPDEARVTEMFEEFLVHHFYESLYLWYLSLSNNYHSDRANLPFPRTNKP